MFMSKKKVKTKDSDSLKDPTKRGSKNISKQFKSFIGRRKASDSDNISQVTSVDSNTDNSLKSSVLETTNIERFVSDVQSYAEENELENEEKVLKYPKWYKQTLNLPQGRPLYLESGISLNILRTTQGDFGFVLRKGICIERFTNDDGYFNEIKDLAIFAEPVNMSRENSLLPGDKLIEVNDVNVQSRLRDEIIDLIKACGSEVKLTIQPSPECLEFSFRRFTNISTNHVNIRLLMREKKGFGGIYKELYNKVVNNFESLSTVQLTQKSDDASSNSEKVWINFNEGFAAASIVKKMVDGKCAVKLLDNQSEIEVSEEDIHPANSAVYDLEENLLLLPHLNESSLLYDIRQRFASNLVHTYVGKHVLYINPMNAFNCFSEKAMHLFKSANPEDIPPHVYSTAQNAYQKLKSTKENQSICILGRSGSGKSNVLKHLVNYFTTITCSNNKSNISNESIQAMWMLLDTFTCTRTGINTNASRCGKRVSLNFSHHNHTLFLSSLQIHIFLFDKNRLFRRPEREPTYHVFYNFLAGVNDKQRQAYHLNNIHESNTFMTPLQRESEKQSAFEQWEMLCQSAFILGISESEWDVICRILATIVHLGVARSTNYQQSANRISGKFLNKEAAKRAAATLNCSEEALYRAVFEYYKEDLGSNDGKQGSRLGLSYNSQDLLNGFASGLYFEVVEMIIFFINRCFSSPYNRIINSVVIVDPPGFQVHTSYNKNQVALYEDLLYNYAYECFLDLNARHNIQRQKQLYAKENVTVEFTNDANDDNSNLLSLLDGDCQAEAFDTIGKKGLLNFIESEALVGNEASLMKRLYGLYLAHHRVVIDKKKRILKTIFSKTGDFTISHCNLSQTLKYNLNDGLKYCRKLPTFSSSEALLSMCHNDTIQDILTSLSKNQSETSDMKYSNKSVLAQTKLEMNDIIQCLMQTDHLSFIYCVSPIPNAGLSQLKDSIEKQIFDENVTCGGLFSVPLVRIQLQSFQILPILRIMKFSYPESLTFDNFYHIVKNIIPRADFPDSQHLDANLVLKMLNYLKINSKRYKIGDNQLFFRLGTVFDLKNSRELASTSFIVKFQSLCRQYLAKKRVEKLKLQTDAIKIIQRNSVMYLKIKEWPWWKLYSRIRPLIGVLRIDEELKLLKEIANELQIKNRELEIERERYRKEERQLENSLDDLKNEQVMCRQNVLKLTGLLEDKEKVQNSLNNQIEELQDKMIEYEDEITKLKTEIKIFRSDSPQKANGDDNSINISSKASNSTFNDIDLEKLIMDSKTQKDELEVELIKTKKVCDNLKLELEDFKFQMENNATVDEIEHKQLQYEKEIKQLQKIIEEESSQRDKLQRENDKMFSEKLVLERELKDLKIEIANNVNQFQPVSSFDFSNMELDEREYLFKKQKSEQDHRIAELEEEIDEINDNYDLSHKENIKLKIQIEKINQDKINELNEKDDEIEHIKTSNQKKIKNLELQLEEDSAKRQSLMRDKREFDRQIIELKQKLENQRDQGLEKKLKRELKSTKDLLNDALDQIEELKIRKENRPEIKELKDKLDDIEHINEVLVKQKAVRDREIDESHQEIESLNKVKYELEVKLKQSKSEVLHLQGLNDDLDTQVEQLERKIKQLQNQVTNGNDVNTNLQLKIESFEDENRRLVVKIDKLEQELSTHSYEQIDKSEVTRLQKKISELEMKLHYEDSAKTRLQTTNDRLKDQLYTAQADKASSQAKEALEQDRLKKLERQLKEARDIEDQQNKEIMDLKIKIKTLIEKNTDIEEDLEKKIHEVTLSKQKIQKLERTIDTLDDDNSDNSYSDILHKADNLIKTRKFSVDQNIVSHRNYDNSAMFRRGSVANDKYTSHFNDENNYN